MKGAHAPHLDADPVLDTWAAAALERLAAVDGVHRVGLAVLEGGGRRLLFTASDRPAAGPRWCHVDAYDDVPLNRAVRTGDTVVGALADLRPAYADFVEAQRGTPTEAVAAVPITAASQVLGGFVLFFERRPVLSTNFFERLTALTTDLGTMLRVAQRGRAQQGDEEWPDEPPGARTVTHDVAPDLAAVGGARAVVRETLSGWGVDQDRTFAALLCLSELVTNALVHGGGRCSVRVSDEAGVITVAVRDAGNRQVARSAESGDPLAVHGRGLRLVDALTSRWGSDVRQSGLTVWFVL